MFWYLPPPASPELTSTELDSDFPHNCWSLPYLPGSAGNGRVPLLFSPCSLAHLVMKRQGCVSNQSLQGQGPGVGEPVDFQYGTGLDLHLGMSKYAQFGSVCRNLCLLFLLALADPTLLLWKSELNSPKNLEGHAGFAQRT